MPMFLMFLILAVVAVVVLAAAVAALGSRLPVVRVCLGEDHLGCFQPALPGRSSPLACSRPGTKDLETLVLTDQAALPYWGML